MFEKQIKKHKKKFNKLSEEQKNIIKKEFDEILKLADKKADEKNDNIRNLEIQNNSICPLCKNKVKGTIVNKISLVKGEGNVSGSFYWGTGSIYGKSSTDTYEINHCNNCGNEWKKFNSNYVFSTDILRDFAYKIYLECKYTFGNDEYNLLKNYYAETIDELFNKHASLYYREKVKLSDLRNKFKSIFDE